MKYLLLFLAVLLMAGCASSTMNDTTWYKSDMTDDQLHKDTAECKKEAAMSENSFAILNWATAIVDNQRQKDIFKDCMEAKGYYLVADTNKTITAKPTK